MKLFEERIKDINPKVIAVKYNQLGNTTFEPEEKNGTFFRVIPNTLKEINALKMLEHRIDKFAPATGNGVLITSAALKMLDA